MEEERYLVYQGQRIKYLLEKKAIKNINVHVRRDGTIYASAPRRVAVGMVEKLLLEHMEQLLSCTRERKSLQEKESQKLMYNEGSNFFYLGKVYQLRLQKGQNGVRFSQEYCYLSLLQPENVAARQRVVDAFYQDMGRRLFMQRLQVLYPYFAEHGVSWPNLRLSKMRTRWGTCNKNKKLITLSVRLLAHSTSSIDYVIMHELCHFIHFDHSARFHGLMTELMPDWAQRKKELEDWAKVVNMT